MKKTVLAAVAALAVLVPLTSAGTAQAEVHAFTATTALDGRTVKDPDVPVGQKRGSGEVPDRAALRHDSAEPGETPPGNAAAAVATVLRDRHYPDNDATTTHVALYLGDNKILEASPPRDGTSVRISELNSHGTPYSKVRRIFG